MALEHKRLIKTQIPTGPAQIGTTVPADKTWYLKEVTLFNTSAAAVTLSFFIGTAAITTNKVFRVTLDAGEYYPVPLEYPWVLEGGEALFGEASANNVVNIFAFGAEG